MKQSERITAALALLSMLCGASSVQAAVWKCEDANGKVQYQQKPCPSGISNVHPMQVSDINEENVLKTIDLLDQAIMDKDVRAQMAFFSDRFEYSLYRNSEFMYPYETLDKSRINMVLSMMNGLLFKDNGGEDDKMEVVDQPADNTYILVVKRFNHLPNARQKMEFVIENGQLLLLKWGYIKP